VSKRATKPEFIPGYLFYGPECPPTPGDLGPYTGETFVYRGYTLHRRNPWRELLQQWDSRETAIGVVGCGADWSGDWKPDGWRASVAGIDADGTSMQEALDEAWAGAEYEGKVRHLIPPEAP
jgi:trans-aconitate methyltransferase